MKVSSFAYHGRLCLVFCLCVSMLVSSTAFAELGIDAQKNVLILNSYHKGYKWTDNIMEGISSVLGADPRHIKLLVEDMDTKRISNEQYINQLYEVYKYKYSNRKIDLVIAADDEAFHFLLQHGQVLFPNTPVVFCGVNYFEDSMLYGHDNMTGVVEAYDIRKTLELALQIHPATQNIYIINDKTITGLGIRRTLMEIIPTFKGINFISWEDYNMQEIQQKIKTLPENSLVLFMVFFQDVSGKYFSYDESISMVAMNSSVPIYGMWDFYLGHGIVGGVLTSGYQQGRMAAQLSRRILDGENAANIPIVRESPNQYMFDNVQMKRFGIRSADLPENSIIINQAYSDRKQVLVLNSYHADMPWVKNISAGIENFFAEDKTVTFYYDYMDAKRNPSPDYIEKLHEVYKAKYSNKKFDAIIVSDDPAYNFLLAYQGDLFPNTPVVFCGVNYFQEQDLAGYEDWFTGVVEQIDMQKTLEVGLKLHPAVTQVVVINDNTLLGQVNRALLQEAMTHFPNIKFIMYEDMNMSEVQERVARLRAESIILLLSFNQDKSNNIFTYEDAIDLIAHAANVPIYGTWDFYLGHGLLGGMLTSGYSQGELVARMTKQVLDGVKPRNIPVVKDSPNRYIFDYEQLKKFNVNLKDLPEDSILINQSPTFYNQYRRLVVGVCFFIFVLVGIISILYITIRRRKKVEAELQIYATTDQMTGVFNRRTGMLFLQKQMALSERSGEKFVICFVDVNGLKKVNDTYGHVEGDKLIQAVGQLLQGPLRRTDIICRFGGDEFFMIFPKSDLKGARAMMLRIAENIQKYNSQKLHHFTIGISFGFAEYSPDHPMTLEEMLAAADNEMYKQKNTAKFTGYSSLEGMQHDQNLVGNARESQSEPTISL